MYHVIDHQLQAARQVASPNFNERPPGAEPELLVIHSISLPPGRYGSDDIEALFTNRLDPNRHPYFAHTFRLEVSAHLLIKRGGELVQFVAFDKRAWHAGKSCHEGRENCNDYSIGIELEGTDTDPFEAVQYQVLADVIRALCAAYPSLSPARVVGHSDIAPGRKTDPGVGFDWQCLHILLRN